MPFIFLRKKKCINYDNLINKKLDDSFSVSIMDKSGFIISEYNSNKLRIPASNLKLLSTGYVIDKYNPYDSLNTSLFLDNKNNYYLIGSGDPDLSLKDVDNLLKIKDSNKEINFNILEVKEDYKWPEGWTYNDKLYNYGAPITSLAINSNNDIYLDKYYLKSYIYKNLKEKYPNSEININILNYKNSLKNKLRLFKNVKSNTILSLVTLANAESHNFTSESLFKNASNNWQFNDYEKLKDWLYYRGFPIDGISINDASGLSRNNKITTKLISTFLYKMRFNRNFKAYNSSLSILGVRGTLANKLKKSNLSGKFFGKTGTLSNVFSLSGYLYKGDNTYIVSIIQNSNNIDINKTFRLISDIYKLDNCI
tara:strand:- start:112 stop:1212 length:1101 start_codon:yes stop_codon:yes gene_type:complete